MREDLNKKILESGLVDRHVAILMESWGANLDSAQAREHRSMTRRQMREFAEELAEILDRDLLGIPDEVSLE